MADNWRTPEEEFEQAARDFEKAKEARLRRTDEVASDLARGGVPDEKSPI